MSSEARRRRTVLVVALAGIVGVLAVLAMTRIGDSLVYYWSPTELQEAGDDAYGAVVRLGGMVEAGTIVHSEDGRQVSFMVTDMNASVAVETKEVPPAMFREGIGVVVEGSLDRDGIFRSDRLMVKHDNEYRAPDGHDDVDMDKVMESLQMGDDA